MTVLPFLMFQGNAEAAMNLYVSIIPDSQILEANYYGPNEAGSEGSIKTAKFSVGGQTVMCIDSPAVHEFSFTAAFSFFVDCESEEQMSYLVAGLEPGGEVFMPRDNYGFSRSFAWISDRFGVSWQLNLP